MLVVPGDKRFDSSLVKKVLNISELRFATEEEVIKITDGVLPGGVPPFGNLFNIPVYADPLLLENEKIAFNAGDKGISIIMNPKDWEKVVNPTVIKIC
jgi:prolyl-tRNA editing enzyme YbaK/EbsC (Cys-tRNA(Pro) deacylase)